MGRTVHICWAAAQSEDPGASRGMGDVEYEEAFQRIVMPIAQEFNPQIVLVYGGLDAAVGDPTGMVEVSPGQYARMTKDLMTLADGKVVVTLCGGYDRQIVGRPAA